MDTLGSVIVKVNERSRLGEMSKTADHIIVQLTNQNDYKLVFAVTFRLNSNGIHKGR